MTFKEFRWNCDSDGCFNKKKRLNFAHFYDCLPGKISFMDIDGMTEINGNVLLLEAKEPDTELARAQRIAFQNITSGGLYTVFIIWGDTYNMDIKKCQRVSNGVFGPINDCDYEGLRSAIRAWGQKAFRQRLSA